MRAAPSTHVNTTLPCADCGYLDSKGPYGGLPAEGLHELVAAVGPAHVHRVRLKYRGTSLIRNRLSP